MSLNFHQIILLILCVATPILTARLTTKKTSWTRVVLPRIIVFYIFGLLTALFEIGRGLLYSSDFELLFGILFLAGLIIGHIVFILRKVINDGCSE